MNVSDSLENNVFGISDIEMMILMVSLCYVLKLMRFSIVARYL